MPDLEDPTVTFQKFDRDGDGYITREEFRLAMSARGEAVTTAELDSIFKVSDENDGDMDGRISFTEFMVAWNK
ncbi:MAG: EF-hand domain-containing protein [Nonomuraea sp.]|nr:EF-hand domain-containing protein [Nonomuraea sp.]NUP65074.1 EF-hand domain-containing protein [Nonomuraea sp.]NUP81880.1 EF-hand domain-containing protein [Nonomuraea sp.]NUS08757.1 EF-hand domain-containing protein [Nonomuraea sp.]